MATAGPAVPYQAPGLVCTMCGRQGRMMWTTDQPTNPTQPNTTPRSFVRARRVGRSPATVHLTPSMGFGFRVSELPQGVGFGFRTSHKGWVLGFGFWGPPEAKFWSLN
jgi:hypothetical protein